MQLQSQLQAEALRFYNTLESSKELFQEGVLEGFWLHRDVMNSKSNKYAGEHYMCSFQHLLEGRLPWAVHEDNKYAMADRGRIEETRLYQQFENKDLIVLDVCVLLQHLLSRVDKETNAVAFEILLSNLSQAAPDVLQFQKMISEQQRLIKQYLPQKEPEEIKLQKSEETPEKMLLGFQKLIQEDDSLLKGLPSTIQVLLKVDDEQMFKEMTRQMLLSHEEDMGLALEKYRILLQV